MLFAFEVFVDTRSQDPIVAWLNKFHESYPLVGILVLLMLIDVLSGVGAAIVTRTISSSVGTNGMVRKVLVLMLIGMCMAIEPYANGLPLSKLAAMAFVFVECTSTIENCARAGLPIPAVITDTLAKLKQADKGSGAAQPGPTQNISINRAEVVDIHPEKSPDQPVASSPDVVASEPRQKGPGSSVIIGK